MTQHTRHHHPELERSLMASCDELKEKVKIRAEGTAFRLLPMPTGDHMRSYWEESHHAFQALIDRINAVYQFQTTCDTVRKKEQAATEGIQVLENKIAEVRQKLIPLETEIKNTPVPAQPGRHKKARIASLVLCLFEGIFSIPVFEAWGMNLLVSSILGLLFAGVLAIFAEVFPKILDLGKTVGQKRLIVLGLFVLTTAMFAFLAIVRADYLNTGDAAKMHIHYSPLPFVCISELMLIIAVCVSYFYRLTPEQKQVLAAYEKLMADKKELDDEITAHEATIETIKTETAEVRTSGMSILVSGSMLEERVINHAKACYALYKSHNLMHRKDQCKPDCFDEPYPFQFTTNFHSIKLLTQ